MMTPHNEQVIQGLEPRKVFFYFGNIASIPHGSGNEKQLAEYIYNLGKNKGWDICVDDYNNVLIRKPASPGYEHAPTLLMQAHLDMVCEKNPGVEHNFLTDPLKLRREGGFLYASGTTLGADNGIGVALLLALLDTEDLQHPALEVLLTADEEAGMSGIKHFDGSQITAHHLLNLDSKMDSLTVACAGGQRFAFHMPYQTCGSARGETYSIVLDGLKGGHSGAEIDKGRANAIKLLGRVVADLQRELDVELAYFRADGKANVIPRRAETAVNPVDAGALQARLDWWKETLRRELADTEPEVTLSVQKIPAVSRVLCPADARRLVQCILLTPSGTLTRNLETGEAIYSNNLGVVTFAEDAVHLYCLCRSSLTSLMNSDYLPLMQTIADTLGITGEVGDSFPCWEYVEDSPLREVCSTAYFRLNGKYPEVISRHAGSECGYIMNVCPSLKDAVATGARLFNMHTTYEHLDIDAVEVAYGYLRKILETFRELA
ncbi:beta-Ala-His dipeptidase [Dysosmobacter sp.]|uniref:beta-Ala-His dipeptidase n=1 Tax=Dysosmobacter sp. TaxID=2591382 RepID=UPI002A9039AA|nr:beta-Ala-His dipeptidase [Dysosmobacter sp.]MDY3282522.1 beta-Ala-His dipeptidase [Dysosmobacter sp.]